MIHYILAFLAVGIGMSGYTQTILFQENFSTGIPETWTVYDQDGLIPEASVAEFNAAWIGKIVGEDTCAASTSFYTPSGQSSDYLITPVLSIGNFSKLVWTARSVDASYPDGYYVLISTTDNAVESFTDTLLYVPAENPLFNTRSIELDIEGYANQEVHIAFKNATTNGYILLLNDVLLLGAETAQLEDYTVQNNPTIQIFPNPAQDFVEIKTTEIIQQIGVYNTAGQALFTPAENRFSVAHLQGGIYFIRVLTANGLQTIPFVKS